MSCMMANDGERRTPPEGGRGQVGHRLFGVQQGSCTPGPAGTGWETVRAVAQVCDEGGFDSFWIPDHFQFGDEPVLECWVTLGALAAATTRLRLSALVTGIPYRNPALLAKMGATLDVISQGRAIMGIGAAWHKEEFDAYGYDVETAADRSRRLEEAAQLLRTMLSQQTTTFAGRYYAVRDAVNVPQPVQAHVPILIGGNGEKVTLRLVAQYGDLCTIFGTPDEVRQRLEVLRAHCGSVGRPYEEITRTHFGWCLIGRTEAEVARKRARYMTTEPFAGIAGTPAQIVARLRAYATAGSQGFLLSMPDAHEIEPLRLFARAVLPAL